MDVLSQALNVAEEADATSGLVTLTFDTSDASHRAALAAALAVLRISGIDEDELLARVDAPPGSAGVLPAGADRAVNRDAGTAAPADRPEEPLPDDPNPEYTAELRRRYIEAMEDLTPDEERRQAAARETFPRVVELLRDGANVAAVAQIQYRRWVEQHLDAVR